MSLAAGARLGPYEIVSAIGAGGMGEVYRARDTRLDREVAIKVLPDALAADGDRLSRFEREAKAVAALSHPNILAIHDTGSQAGRMFVVTELLEGETLRARVQQGPMPVRKATEVATLIARGLAAAHDKGIVHRDLKPENVFLLKDGQVKILDFGLARTVPSGAAETAAGISDPGAVMGTVGYMAPEQVRGQMADARADLFALGTVLYEMLTGQRAFKRDTAADTAFAIVKEDPREIATLRPDVPLALARIVRHCLEKNPEERFQSARDVAFALESSSDSGPSIINQAGPGRVEKTTRVSPIKALAGLAIGAALVLVIWLAWKGTSSPPPSGNVAAMTIAIGAAAQLTADDGLEIDPAISPDGKMLAYAAGKPTRMRIFIRPVTGGRTIPLSEGREAFEYQPRWSPDGTQILYLTPHGVLVASSLGGTSRKIVTGAVDGAAWSPTGQQLAIVRGATLSVVEVDGGSERTLGRASDVLYSCDWSSRDWIACALGNASSVLPGGSYGNIAPSILVLIGAGGGQFVEVTDRAALNQSPVWSADGRQLYFVSNRQGPRDIYVVDIPEDGKVQGEPRRVTTGLGAQAIAFSATAQRLVYVAYAARANIWSLPIPSGASGPADTSAARALTSGNQIIEAISVSRDRQWLLYDSNLHLNAEIFRLPLAGGAAERLTTDPADDFAPDLSPDGREVTYHSWRSGSRDIFTRTLDGGPLQQVTASPSHESYPIWSPDGRAIAFVDQSLENGLMTRGLFVVRRDGTGRWSQPVGLAKGVGSRTKGIGGLRCAWLPDGLAVAIPRNGGIELIAADGGPARVVYAPAPASTHPEVKGVAVSEDGRTLYFKSHDSEGRASIWGVPTAGGGPRLLVRFSDPSRVSIRADFAAGAGRFFFTLEDRQADIWMAEITRR